MKGTEQAVRIYPHIVERQPHGCFSRLWSANLGREEDCAGCLLAYEEEERMVGIENLDMLGTRHRSALVHHDSSDCGFGRET